MRRAVPWLVLGGLVLVLFAIEALRPRPYDDRLRVERSGTEPFDAEVLYRLLPAWLGAPVEAVDGPPFERLADTTLANTLYLFLTDSFEPDEAEADRLLSFALRGNTVLAVAQDFGGPLSEALGDTSDAGLDTGFFLSFGVGDLAVTDTLYLPAADRGAGRGGEARGGAGVPYVFPTAVAAAPLVGMDPATTRLLATDADGEPVAVSVRVGAGRVVVSSAPLAFTNAALAGEGDAAAWVGGVLGAAPPPDLVLWDGYYKPLRTRAGSQLGIAAREPALRWALALAVLGALLLVVFRGRRWQRAVPVVAPPPNAQREFARVLGRLHFEEGDTAWLARRKALAFEDALRTRLGIADADLSDATARRAAARAGVDEGEALALFGRLRALRAETAPQPDRLVRADRDVQAFLDGTAGGAVGDGDAAAAPPGAEPVASARPAPPA